MDLSGAHQQPVARVHQPRGRRANQYLCGHFHVWRRGLGKGPGDVPHGVHALRIQLGNSRPQGCNVLGRGPPFPQEWIEPGENRRRGAMDQVLGSQRAVHQSCLVKGGEAQETMGQVGYNLQRLRGILRREQIRKRGPPKVHLQVRPVSSLLPLYGGQVGETRGQACTPGHATPENGVLAPGRPQDPDRSPAAGGQLPTLPGGADGVLVQQLSSSHPAQGAREGMVGQLLFPGQEKGRVERLQLTCFLPLAFQFHPAGSGALWQGPIRGSWIHRPSYKLSGGDLLSFVVGFTNPVENRFDILLVNKQCWMRVVLESSNHSYLRETTGVWTLSLYPMDNLWETSGADRGSRCDPDTSAAVFKF